MIFNKNLKEKDVNIYNYSGFNNFGLIFSILLTPIYILSIVIGVLIRNLRG